MRIERPPHFVKFTIFLASRVVVDGLANITNYYELYIKHYSDKNTCGKTTRNTLRHKKYLILHTLIDAFGFNWKHSNLISEIKNKYENGLKAKLPINLRLALYIIANGNSSIHIIDKLYDVFVKHFSDENNIEENMYYIRKYIRKQKPFILELIKDAYYNINDTIVYMPDYLKYQKHQIW